MVVHTGTMEQSHKKVFGQLLPVKDPQPPPHLALGILSTVETCHIILVVHDQQKWHPLGLKKGDAQPESGQTKHVFYQQAVQESKCFLEVNP